MAAIFSPAALCRPRGLRAHLAALASLIMIPALGTGLVGVWLAMDNHRGATEARLREAARIVALLVNREIGTHLAALEALAASPLLDEPEHQTSGLRLHLIRAANTLGTPLWLFGADLVPLLDTGSTPQSGLAREDAARAAVAGGHPALGPLEGSPQAAPSGIAIAVPVRRGGRSRAMLALHLPPERISGLLAAPELFNDTVIAIANGAGQLVAQSREAEGSLGSTIPAWAATAHAGHRSGLVSGHGPERVRVTMAFHAIDGTATAGSQAWSVMVMQPAGGHAAVWWRAVGVLGGGGLVALAAALALAFWFGNRILAPLGQLKREAEAVALAAGEFAEPPQVPPPSSGPLIREFEMLRRVLEQALSVLRTSERRYSALAEAGAAGLWWATARGSILRSRGWELLTGQAEAEMRGNGWLRALHPEDVAPTMTAWRGAMEDRRPVDVEYRVRLRSGAWRWHRARGVPILDGAGQISEWFGVVEDIHDRRAAEAELAASEAGLRALVEAAPDAIVVMDEDSIIRAFNQGAERIFGYAAAEVIGHDIAVLMPGPLAARHAAGMRRFLQTGERRVIGVGAELEGLHRDGHAVPLEASIGEWRDAGGARFFTGVLRDITERRAAEERQVLLAREVDHRAKNALAVVQSVLRLTPMEEPRAFVAAVEARIGALARAHSLLAQQGWMAADLAGVAARELAPYGRDEAGVRQGVVLEGPCLSLAPSAVQAVAMALHELATNAAKHGGFSVPGGQVTLRWTVEQDVLRIIWTESGGPPVQPPTRSGFGSRLIRTTLRGQLGGSVDWDWRPEGMVCSMTLPLSRISPRPPPAASLGSPDVETSQAGCIPQAMPTPNLAAQQA
ncbi:sensor histidine kinase [Pseudoroseomonas globiformis]|uniref:histidine kinase n=1 Tax=Teichococcus globiformis TaxID=2307229 RepID=A0ABV7FTT1_9PROT